MCRLHLTFKIYESDRFVKKMLRHLFRTTIKLKLANKILETESWKGLCGRHTTVKSRNYCSTLGKLEQTCSVRFGYQHNKSYGSKPTIILGGILSFFGFKDLEEEDPLILAIKKGILCIQREQYENAEEMLHSALKMAQDLHDEDGITYVYDVLANLAFVTKQYEKAHKLFVSVLQRILAKGEAEDSNKVMDISLKLAKMYEENKEYEKAELGYKFCIATLDKKLESDDQDTLALWGMSMDWYARFLLGVNRNSEALACFEKAYDMCVKVNGIESEQSVILLNALGTVSTVIGDQESAINYLEKARDLGKKLPDMQDIAAIYVNLGQLYLLREMYNESKSACQEGFKIAKSNKDETAISEANKCLQKISDVLKKGNPNKGLSKTAQLTLD